MSEATVPNFTHFTSYTLASLIHGVFMDFNAAFDTPLSPEWTELAETEQARLVAGLEEIWKSPDLTVEKAHEDWMARMLAAGWVYGEEKSWENKVHPNLKPFAELDKLNQIGDEFFVQAARTLQRFADNPVEAKDLAVIFTLMDALFRFYVGHAAVATGRVEIPAEAEEVQEG